MRTVVAGLVHLDARAVHLPFERRFGAELRAALRPTSAAVCASIGAIGREQRELEAARGPPRLRSARRARPRRDSSRTSPRGALARPAARPRRRSHRSSRLRARPAAARRPAAETGTRAPPRSRRQKARAAHPRATRPRRRRASLQFRRAVATSPIVNVGSVAATPRSQLEARHIRSQNVLAVSSRKDTACRFDFGQMNTHIARQCAHLCQTRGCAGDVP